MALRPPPSQLCQPCPPNHRTAPHRTAPHRTAQVAGLEVDLHLLYKEVTALGGLDLVISRKQWVVVSQPFNFPQSFTNKSFVIKVGLGRQGGCG